MPVWLKSTTVVGALLAALVAVEAVVLASGLPDAVRYAVAGAGVVALLLGVAQLGASKRHTQSLLLDPGASPSCGRGSAPGSSRPSDGA